MDNEKFLKKIKKNGIDPDNLSSDDIKTLIEMNLKGEFGKDIFKDFLKENNTSYKIFLDGLKSFIETHKSSSDKYTQVLDDQIKELNKQLNNAATKEEREEIDEKIESILNRLQKEARENRKHGRDFVIIAGGVLTIVGGSAVYLVTRNPEVIKKGTEMIAKETIKQIAN